MKLKHLLLAGLVAVAAFFHPGEASALSGAGAVTAVKSGAFTVKYFNGTQAGIDSAVAYCTPSGTVSLGPGLEALSPTGPIPSTVLVIRTGSGGWTLDGAGATLRVPRLGPSSTSSSGGAIRIVNGVTFPLTVAGVQAALDECEASGSGTVWVPANAGIVVSTTSVKIPNRVRLIGMGTVLSNVYTFVASNTANVSAMVENKTQNGTQHYVAAENIQINGNRGGGAIIGAGLKVAQGGFITSYLRDILITGCSGYGLSLTGTTDGPNDFLIENVWVKDCADHNVFMEGKVSSITINHLASEHPAVGKAAIYCSLGASTTLHGESKFSGLFFEGTNASDGLVLDRCANIAVDNVVYDGANFNNVIKIIGSGTGSDGAFGAAGHTFRNIRGNITTIIDDQSAGVTIANAQGRFVDFYRSPKAPDDRITGQVIGLQPARQRAAIASTATLVLPKCGWSDTDVSGTTTVTAITGQDCFLFQRICFWTSAALQFTDGGNLNLNGNFVGNATGGKDCLCGEWDGTNFNETSRSLN